MYSRQYIHVLFLFFTLIKEIYEALCLHIAQSLFRDEIWDYACDHLAEWELSKGITHENKRASSAGFKRWLNPNNNISPSQAPITRWKSWIAQAIDTGWPWLGFHIHINSLVLGLVHQ